MNASVLRKTLPTGAPVRLVVLLFLVAVLMALAASLLLEPVLSSPVATVQTVMPPDTWAGPVRAPSPFIDHSVVDWDRVPLESDPSPPAVAAYGN
jgi:hypothetical protein